MSVLMEFSIFPTDRGESVSREVSQVITMIRESGLVYQLTAMGTIIEGDDLDEVLGVVRAACNLLDQDGCRPIYASLKLDIRKGRSNGLQGKLESINRKIGGTRDR